MIYHITSQAAWDAAQQAGVYSAPSLDAEGFIHLSTRAQVLPVADLLYGGQTGLLLLAVDESRLEAPLQWEGPAGPTPDSVADDARFPHLYGPLNLEAVVDSAPLVPSKQTGGFLFPEELA